MSKQERDQLIEDIFFSALPISKRSDGIEFDLFISNPSINDEVPFGNLRAPTLILNAIDDPATLIEGARNLKREIQNSKLVTFKTGGHILLGQSEEIIHQISEFILGYA